MEDKSSRAWAELAEWPVPVPPPGRSREQHSPLPSSRDTPLPPHPTAPRDSDNSPLRCTGTVLALAGLQESKSAHLKYGLALRFASSTSRCCRLSTEQGFGWAVEAPVDTCTNSQPRPCQTLCSESERRPEGLSSYQHGGGDGEGTGSDARDEVQQVIGWDGARGVREIPQSLQSQEGEAW